MTGLLIALVVLVAIMLLISVSVLALVTYWGWHDRRQDAEAEQRLLRFAERRAAENGRPHTHGVTQRATPRDHE